MEIILQGLHSTQEASKSLSGVLQLFKERYQVGNFKEIHLSVVLVDEEGEEVELIDSETENVYRVFEVYREGYELIGRKGNPDLKLVIDNT